MSLRHRLCVCLRDGARMYVSRVPLFAGGHRTFRSKSGKKYIMCQLMRYEIHSIATRRQTSSSPSHPLYVCVRLCVFLFLSVHADNICALILEEKKMRAPR